ncbi:hypothetical protein BT69DRAFT_1046958 [Atractiella rhizophila]|nr:hypothetical protein BT69DRAFT_1046958 [Atractiella rhizophila]
MHKVPTSLRDQLKRRKEEHESDSELDRGSEVGFTVLGLQANGRQLIVTEACAESLEWPIELLTHAQRENITFVFFQAWLAVLSLVALAYGSVPHLLAVIICHLLALGYSVFQTFSTKYFHDRFHREIVEKSCNGSELLPRYWEDVLHLRIATLVVEGIVTSLLAAVAWRLWKIMDWKTWKLIGASKGHGRLYKLLLSYRIALQMGAFFIVAFQALWLNEICHARGRGMSGVFLTDGYKALLVFLIVFLPLWLVLGWHIVEGPKSRLSEGGKKVMNFLKVDGLGRKIGWRGGKGWGMTGTRGKNIRLAVFGVGAGAVFLNEVFLLSKLRGWDWSFLT